MNVGTQLILRSFSDAAPGSRRRSQADHAGMAPQSRQSSNAYGTTVGSELRQIAVPERIDALITNDEIGVDPGVPFAVEIHLRASGETAACKLERQDPRAGASLR